VQLVVRPADEAMADLIAALIDATRTV